MEIRKTALICQGGGMKGAFVAGAVYGLAKDYGIKQFDVLIGASSSAPTLTYYLTGQIEEIKQVWETELAKSALIKKSNFFKGEPVFNINYLVETVFQKRYPLALAKLQSAPGDLFIPFYNFITDQIEFYHNHNPNQRLDIWQALKATMTVHDKYLSQDQGPNCYADPALVSPLVYQKAIEEGCHDYLIITNRYFPKERLRNWLSYRLFYLFQSRHFPKVVRAKLKKRPQIIKKGRAEFQEFSKNHQVFVIQPPPGVKFSIVANKVSAIKAALECGRQAVQTINGQTLKEFLARSDQLSKY